MWLCYLQEKAQWEVDMFVLSSVDSTVESWYVYAVFSRLAQWEVDMSMPFLLDSTV